MSTYYMFAIGKRSKDGKIELVGPKYSGNVVHPFFTRSRSFIEGDEILEQMYGVSEKDVDVSASRESVTDGLSLTYTDTDYNTGKEVVRVNNAYYLDARDVTHMGASRGLVSGYATIEDAEFINKNGFDEAMCEGISLMSEKTYAGISEPSVRGQYVHVAGVCTRSLAYVCSIAAELLDEVYTYEPADYVMVCVVG